jgi:recombination protein RecT
MAPPADLAALRREVEGGPFLAQLQRAMPPGLTPQRLVRQTVSLIRQKPELLTCTQVSILSGIMQAAELGLELTGPLGHAYLIPRRVRGHMQACFQIGYKGLIALAYRSPALDSVTMRLIRANDHSDWAYGTEHYFQHRPARGDRGPVTHYSAVAHFKGRGHDFEVWSVAEAQAHRQRYSPPSGRPSGWDTHFDAMALKSVLSALCRRMSLCPQAQAAATVEHYLEAGIDVRESEEGRTRASEVIDQLDATFGPPEGEAGTQEAEVPADGR